MVEVEVCWGLQGGCVGVMVGGGRFRGGGKCGEVWDLNMLGGGAGGWPTKLSDGYLFI